jgi:hypothetical protein
MIEFLDPQQTARYEQVVTPANLKRFFVPDAVARS